MSARHSLPPPVDFSRSVLGFLGVGSVLTWRCSPDRDSRGLALLEVISKVQLKPEEDSFFPSCLILFSSPEMTSCFQNLRKVKNPYSSKAKAPRPLCYVWGCNLKGQLEEVCVEEWESVLFLPTLSLFTLQQRIFLLFCESANTGLLTDFYELKIPSNSTASKVQK